MITNDQAVGILKRRLSSLEHTSSDQTSAEYQVHGCGELQVKPDRFLKLSTVMVNHIKKAIVSRL